MNFIYRIIHYALIFLIAFSLQFSVQADETENYFKIINKGDLNLVKSYNKNGIPLNPIGSDGRTALIYAIERGKLNIVSYFIEQGVDTTMPQGNPKLVPLHYAIEKRKMDIAIAMLPHIKDLNSKDLDGNTALYLATVRNEQKFIKQLLDQKVNINETNHNGYTALMGAVFKKNRKVFQLLLEYNADTQIKDDRGRTIVHYIVDENESLLLKDLASKKVDYDAIDKDGFASIHLAIQKNRFDCFKNLLENNANIHLADKDGKYPLLETYTKNKDKFFQLILQFATDISPIDSGGNNILHLSVQKKDFLTTETVIKKNINKDATNNLGKTALIIAAESNHSGLIKLLIEKGANPKIKDQSNRTAFHYLMKHGNKEMTNLFISKSIDVNELDSTNYSPIKIAFENRKYDIVQTLIENNATVDIILSDGKSLLQHCIEKNLKEIGKLVIQKTKNLNEPLTNGEFPILATIELGRIELLVNMLDQKVDISKKDKDGNTSIVIATEKNYTKIVEYLLEKGANPSTISASNKFKGLSLLEIALDNNNGEIFKALIKKGADYKFIDNNGKSVLHRAAEKGVMNIIQVLLDAKMDVNLKDKDGNTALLLAVDKNRQTTVKFLLDNQSNINATNSELLTTVMLATKNGNREMVNLLILRGANINAANQKGQTALFMALENDQMDILKDLIQSNADIHYKNKNNCTILMELGKADLGKRTIKAIEIIKLLLDKSANINETDLEGNTALSYAVSKSNFEMIAYLISKGADLKLQNKLSQTALHKIINDSIAQNIDMDLTRQSIYLLALSGVDINGKNDQGSNALIQAIQSGALADSQKTVQLIEILLDLGIQVLDKNKDGKSAIDIGQETKNLEIQQALKINQDGEKIQGILFEMYGTVNDDIPQKIFVDEQENVYIHALIHEKHNVLKFNSKGELLLSREFPNAKKILVDSKGNIYVSFVQLIEGAKDNCPEKENLIIKLKKYDADGKELFSQDYTRKKACKFTDVLSMHITSENHIFLGALLGENNYELIQLDSDGKKLWNTYRNEGWTDSGMDNSENIYLFGKSLHYYNSKGKSSKYKTDWTSDSYKICSDSFRNVYFSEENSKVGFVLHKFDKNGKLIWKRIYSSQKAEKIIGLHCDANNHVYIYGNTTENLHGNTNSGKTDLFIVKINPEGKRIWTKQFGGLEEEEFISYTFSHANLYIVGTTKGSLSNKNAKGGKDIFILKYNITGK